MTKYQKQKKAAREKAINWQLTFSKCSCSWSELAAANHYFEKLGMRFGLLSEFRANGII